MRIDEITRRDLLKGIGAAGVIGGASMLGIDTDDTNSKELLQPLGNKNTLINIELLKTSSSQEVKKVQQFLKDRGQNIKVDGIAGLNTVKMASEFNDQQRKSYNWHKADKKPESSPQQQDWHYKQAFKALDKGRKYASIGNTLQQKVYYSIASSHFLDSDVPGSDELAKRYYELSRKF